MKLAGCKSFLNPAVVYSADRSKAVVLVLFLLFPALCSLVVPALLSVFFFFFVVVFWRGGGVFVCFLFCLFVCLFVCLFFYMCCDVVTVFNSCPLCFLFY